MAGDALGSLLIKITGDMSEAKAALEKTQYIAEQTFNKITTAGKAMESAMKGVVAGIASGLSVGLFVDAIKGSIDLADHLNDLSKSTGIAVEQLSGLRVAAKQSGGDLDSVAASINKLSVNIGQSGDKFAALGVTAKDPLEAFKQLADVFSKIQDPQLRAALGAEALGKAWAGAAPLLAEGGDKIGEMVAKGQELSRMTKAVAEAADEFNDKLVLLTGTGGLWTGIADSLLPMLNSLAGYMLDAKKNTEGVDEGFHPLLETLRALVVLGGNVAFVFKGIGTELGGMAAQLGALASGNFSEFATIRKLMVEDAEKARVAFDQWEASIMKIGSASQEAAKKIDSMDQVTRRAASTAAAVARQESEAATARAKAFADYEKNLKAAAEAYKKWLAEEERLRKLDAKGWVEYIEAREKEDTDALKEEEKRWDAHWKLMEKMRLDDLKGTLEFIDKMAEANDELLTAMAAQVPSMTQLYTAARDALSQSLTETQKEITLVGLSNLERAKAIALMERDLELKKTEIAIHPDLVAKVKELYEARIKLLDMKDMQSKLQEMSNSLTDVLLNAFEKGKDGVKLFIDWLKQQFAKLVLRPLIEPIAGSAASLILSVFGLAGAGGASAAGIGGGTSAGGIGNLFSLGSGVYNNGSAGLGWLTGGFSADAAAGLPAGTILGQSAPSFWSAGSFGSVGTAGGLVGTAALGALGGSLIASHISKDEDASRNGALAGAAGSVIGAYVATGTAIGGPWGAVIGAVIGGLIAAFSDMDGPAMRTAAVVAGATLDKYTYQLESKLGTLGIAKGSDKWFSDSEMGATLTDWFKTIQNIDDSIADRLTDAQLIAAKLAVSSGSMTLDFGIEHQDVDPAAFGHIIQDRYSKVFGAVDEAMGALISGFEGTTGDLLKLVDDLATVNYQLTANGAALAKVFGETIDFADIQKFNVAGEAFGATLQRLGAVYYATNAIAAMFGKTQEQVWGAIGLASEAARQALIEAAGGLDAFTSRLNSFYQHYYTAEERLMHTHDALAATFAGLNLTMPTSLDAFRKLVESLDLTTDAGRAAWTALMGIEGQFYDFITATTKASESTADLTDHLVDLSDVIAKFGNPAIPWTGPSTRDDPIWRMHPGEPYFPRTPIDDMGDTAKAAQEAHDALVKLNETLTNSFKDAYRTIEMAGLSNQAQYEYLQREAAGYVTNLQGATTGEGVQNWAEKIKSDMLAAFNLLDPGEQGSRKQEFLDNLLKVSQMVTDRLAALDPLGTLGHSGADVSPAQAAANSQVQAAVSNLEAAKILREAAALYADTTAAFALAQTIPKKVSIDLAGVGTVEAGG